MELSLEALLNQQAVGLRRLMRSERIISQQVYYSIYTYTSAYTYEQIANMEGEKMTAGDGQWVREREAEAEANGASASRIQIARSLRRSRVRTEIVMYLYKIHPVAYYLLSEQGKSVMDEVVIYDTT